MNMTVDIISPKALRLPLLALRDNNEPIEYLLLKINKHSALISLPNWVINRASLNEGELISLNLKQYLGTLNAVEGYATLVGAQWNSYENLYRIDWAEPLIYSRFEERDRSAKDELFFLLKDSYLLKNGILVILKHLIPYFSRILHLSRFRYKNLRTALLDEVLLNVYENMTELENLHRVLSEQIMEDRDIPVFVNLEKLRKLMQSEIDFSLFVMAFDNYRAGMKRLNQLFQNQTYSLKSHTLYLDAIKVTERRLYNNYNAIVGLFSKSFGD